jgi:hypothetical protein
VICPCCNEDIGLSESGDCPELLTHIFTATQPFARFFCHVCKSGWELTAQFKPLPGEDDD